MLMGRPAEKWLVEHQRQMVLLIYRCGEKIRAQACSHSRVFGYTFLGNAKGASEARLCGCGMRQGMKICLESFDSRG